MVRCVVDSVSSDSKTPCSGIEPDLLGNSSKRAHAFGLLLNSQYGLPNRSTIQHTHKAKCRLSGCLDSAAKPIPNQEGSCRVPLCLSSTPQASFLDLCCWPLYCMFASYAPPTRRHSFEMQPRFSTQEATTTNGVYQSRAKTRQTHLSNAPTFQLHHSSRNQHHQPLLPQRHFRS